MITRDKAISILRARLECMRRQDKFEECCMVKDCDNCQTNYEAGNYGEWKETLRLVLSELERKTGNWTKTNIRISSGDFTRGVKCSKCGYVTIVDDFKYCPNCGDKKMEEGDTEC